MLKMQRTEQHRRQTSFFGIWSVDKRSHRRARPTTSPTNQQDAELGFINRHKRHRIIASFACRSPSALPGAPQL
jgi:hypothetical protein